MEHWAICDLFPLDMVYIESPTMMEDRDGTKIFNNFSAKRQLYTQFKKLERTLKKAGMNGWVGNTEIDHTVFIKIIVKCGGQPYYIDLKSNLIWFKKVFTKEE